MTAPTVAVRKLRPIIMSGESVRATLDGRKTATRRVVIPQPELQPSKEDGMSYWFMYADSPDAKKRSCWLDGDAPYLLHSPYAAGDRLWVREKFSVDQDWDNAVFFPDGSAYRTGCKDGDRLRPSTDADTLLRRPKKWQSPIFMPRWASRLTVELTAVRVERLQDITEADAIAEGVKAFDGQFAGAYGIGPALSGTTARECYARWWDSLNKKRSPWARNDWVRVLTYAVVPS